MRKVYRFENIIKEVELGARQALEKSLLYDSAEEKIINRLRSNNCLPKNETIKNATIKYLAETNRELYIDNRPARVNGLAFFGTTGTGKTFASKIISAFREYSFYKAEDIVELYKHGQECFTESIKSHLPIVIDDVGTENKLIQFGQVTDVLQLAISMRSDLFVEYGILTVLTSNLDKKSFIERYGDRTFSRMKGMCECVIVSGQDLRINKN